MGAWAYWPAKDPRKFVLIEWCGADGTAPVPEDRSTTLTCAVDERGAALLAQFERLSIPGGHATGGIGRF